MELEFVTPSPHSSNNYLYVSVIFRISRRISDELPQVTNILIQHLLEYRVFLVVVPKFGPTKTNHIDSVTSIWQDQHCSKQIQLQK